MHGRAPALRRAPSLHPTESITCSTLLSAITCRSGDCKPWNRSNAESTLERFFFALRSRRGLPRGRPALGVRVKRPPDSRRDGGTTLAAPQPHRLPGLILTGRGKIGRAHG